MKKACLFIFYFFFTTQLIIGQYKSGHIIYKVNNIAVENTSNNPEYKNFKKKIDEIAKELSFELKFDQTKSVFNLVKYLPLGKNKLYANGAITILGGKEVYYTDIKDKFIIKEKNFLGEPFLIKTPLNQLNWNLTNQTKQISGYKCYKAISYRESTNKNFEKKKVPVYAWYTPDIPINFGPFEAAGLPGLVLEFGVVNYSYVATKINLNEKITLKKPKKGKIISNIEYNELIVNKFVKKRKQQ